MKPLLPFALGTTLLACITLASPAAQAQSDCDRSCLANALDAYLNAVVAHDPAAAPLALGIRQTENAINVAPGRGTWQSVTALGEVQRRYYDPGMRGAREPGQPPANLLNIDYLKDNGPPQRVVPEGERADHDVLPVARTGSAELAAAHRQLASGCGPCTIGGFITFHGTAEVHRSGAEYF